MTGIEVLAAVTAFLVILGAVELWLHRRRLGRIRIRVHVNGTRGKSSVTRLIAAGLREAGMVTYAKTTGSSPCMILPDGRELPIHRSGGPNIIEQKRMVAAAAAGGAEALVLECMALSPLLQSVCELKLVRATHAVITNVRPDHLEVMGPGEPEVGSALAGMTPVAGKLYTSERKHLPMLRMAAADRRSQLTVVEPFDEPDGLGKFRYTEHADNVALALAVCTDLGVRREIALRGMWKAQPDPGAMTERRLDFFGRRIVFVNGFAANDPVSTEQVWSLALERHDGMQRKIAVFNCRSDRPERSRILGAACAGWRPADHVVLMGSHTHLFADAAARAGIDATKLVFVEGLPVEEVFERIVSLAGESALVMGMGNIGGDGIKLAAYFANRAAPEKE